MVHSTRRPLFRRFTGSSALFSLACVFLLAGCVREEFRDTTPRAGPALFSFPVEYPRRIMEAGTYHGTNLYFEVDLEKDALPYRGWSKTQDANVTGQRLQLPPMVPQIGQGREVYRVGDLYHIELYAGRWDTGSFKYPSRRLSSLYLFKPQRGEFRFLFRGQEVAIQTDRLWQPSVYYYSEEENVFPEGAEDDGRRKQRGRRLQQVVREVVQVGFTTIEKAANGTWLVNQRRFRPEPGRVLNIRSGLRTDLAPKASK